MSSEAEILKQLQTAIEGVTPDRMAMMVGIKDGRIRLDFPEAVEWYAMTPDEADAFAAIITKMAERIRHAEP